MSRRRSIDTEVTLLPFLAVLVCTMGALIVLLVVVMQQAQVGGAEQDLANGESSLPTALDSVADQTVDLTKEIATSTPETPALGGPTADEVGAVQQMRDEQLARIETLNQTLSQSQTTKQEKQAVLGEVDAEIESIVGQLTQLQQTVEAMSGKFAQAVNAESEAESIAEIERQISVKQAELASVRDAANNEPATYHIVPYNGSGGTARRPIYIECLPGEAIIRPEGVVFTESDFETAKYPDNVLATTLGAIRDHWSRNDGEADRGDAYPLLVVRPGGEESYRWCRAAMKSWDDEFGYELVDADVRLEYSEPNDALAAVIRETQSLARQQQRHNRGLRQGLAENQGPSLRASRSGGFVRQGGSGSFALATSRMGGPNRADAPNQTGGQSSMGGQNGMGSTNESGPGGGVSGSNQFSNNDQKRRRVYPSQMGDPRQSSGHEGPSSNQPPQLGNLSLAKKRGKDWALPNAVDDGIPLVRPLYVVMNKAQVVLEAEPGTRQVPTVISLEPGPSAVVQSMVTSIWDRIASWGAAGPGVYWRPRLEFDVAPGSEDDFERVARLLDGSGLELAQTKSNSMR